MSACLPCSPSQICPEGTTTPTAGAVTTTWQIVIYVLSAIGSVIGILVAMFRVYPAIKARVDKLREAGIKPTLKRVVFLHKTLSRYRPAAGAERAQRQFAGCCFEHDARFPYCARCC